MQKEEVVLLTLPHGIGKEIITMQLYSKIRSCQEAKYSEGIY